MVLVFMGMTLSTREYLGSILFVSAISCLYNTIFRFAKGILVVSDLPYIGLGIVAILLGVLVANKIVDKLDEAKIRKITYVMIGIAGIINLLSLS